MLMKLWLVYATVVQKKIKAGRQTANINTIKTLEVSPRKGPLFSDTSKKINK